MLRRSTNFFASIFIFISTLAPQALQNALPLALPEAFDIQLESPVFSNGVLSTDKGGFLKGKNLYIQAKSIRYTKKGVGTELVHKIEAEGELYMEFNGKPYKGEKVEVNLETNRAVVWNGCTEADQWYLGGRVIEIMADGNVVFHDAFVTTSENEQNDWSIEAATVKILPGDKLTASNVRFYFIRAPFLWVPSYTANLKEQDGGPITYRVRWGGGTGLSIGAMYSFASFSNWRTKLVAQYNVKNGFGAGLIANYRNAQDNISYQSFWFGAQGRNKAWSTPRYRFQGLYRQSWRESDVNFRFMYDKLSDSKMKSDFSDHAVNDAVAGRTDAKLWKTTHNWIASLEAQVRVNNFQDVKQQLPMATLNTRPQVLGRSGVIMDTKISSGYLDYLYAHNTPHVRNFASTRSEIGQNFYRNFLFNPLVVTPRVGYHLIHYSSSPQHQQRMQGLVTSGLDLSTRLIGTNSNCFQILEPYASFDSITHPLVRPNRYYVFDLEDGFAQVNTLRFGVKQQLMIAPGLSGFSQRFLFDFYTRAFFDQNRYKKSLPKIYFDTSLFATPWQTYSLETAWDRDHNVLDHFNIMGKFTISDTLAFILEYRDRSQYAWRKIDQQNFIIDMARSENRLLHSEMSDKRQLVRTAFFWQIAHSLDLEGSIRQGFGRKHHPRYTEWDLTLGTVIRGALIVKFTYEKRLNDNRFYLSFSLGQRKPSQITSFKKIGFANYDL